MRNADLQVLALEQQQIVVENSRRKLERATDKSEAFLIGFQCGKEYSASLLNMAIKSPG